MKGLLILLLAVFVLISLALTCRAFHADVKIVRYELAECTLYGTATNLGRVTAQDVEVYAKFTDRNGLPVGSDLSYAIGKLREEESAEFSFIVPQEQCDRILSYEVWAKWSE